MCIRLLGENLHAIISVVNDHDFSVFGDGDAVGVAKAILVVVDSLDKSAIGAELEHAAVPVVADIDIVVGIDGDAGWVLELVFALTGRRHLQDVFAVRIEDLDI